MVGFGKERWADPKRGAWVRKQPWHASGSDLHRQQETLRAPPAQSFAPADSRVFSPGYPQAQTNRGEKYQGVSGHQTEIPIKRAMPSGPDNRLNPSYPRIAASKHEGRSRRPSMMAAPPMAAADACTMNPKTHKASGRSRMQNPNAEDDYCKDCGGLTDKGYAVRLSRQASHAPRTSRQDAFEAFSGRPDARTVAGGRSRGMTMHDVSRAQSRR